MQKCSSHCSLHACHVEISLSRILLCLNRRWLTVPALVVGLKILLTFSGILSFSSNSVLEKLENKNYSSRASLAHIEEKQTALNWIEDAGVTKLISLLQFCFLTKDLSTVNTCLKIELVALKNLYFLPLTYRTFLRKNIWAKIRVQFLLSNMFAASDPYFERCRSMRSRRIKFVCA